MQLESMTPMLRTWDLEGAISFYVDMLGFECEDFSEEFGWASLRFGEVMLMLARPNAHDASTEAFFTGSLYFRVGDVDALWERLRDAASVCYPLETFDYGMREFAIYDRDGYLLQFGQQEDWP